MNNAIYELYFWLERNKIATAKDVEVEIKFNNSEQARKAKNQLLSDFDAHTIFDSQNLDGFILRGFRIKFT